MQKGKVKPIAIAESYPHRTAIAALTPFNFAAVSDFSDPGAFAEFQS